MNKLLPNPWLLGMGITILSYILIFGVKKLLCTRMSHVFGKARTKWDDIVVETVQQTTHLFMLGASLYLAYKLIPHSRKNDLWVDRTFFFLTMIQVGIWLNTLVDRWITSFISRKTRKNPAAASSISLIQLFSKFVILSIIFLMTLNNLGIKITTILAGFGVGGIAVALALQKILGDLFSSLSIVMDKPFVVGDFIVLDQFMGEVEKIGLKTTRIRSLGGEQIIISNSDLLGTRIRNFKRMHERRVVFVLNLVHSSSADDLRKAVSLIKAIISSKERVRFERSHFMGIRPVSLDIETVYWVLSDDYDLYMDIQQDILLGIKKAFEAEKLLLAYPTQTVHVEPRELLIRSDRQLPERTAGADVRSMS